MAAESLGFFDACARRWPRPPWMAHVHKSRFFFVLHDRFNSECKQSFFVTNGPRSITYCYRNAIRTWLNYQTLLLSSFARFGRSARQRGRYSGGQCIAERPNNARSGKNRSTSIRFVRSHQDERASRPESGARSFVDYSLRRFNNNTCLYHFFQETRTMFLLTPCNAKLWSVYRE